MAAPVAIQLAGAMEMAGAGGSGAPKSPTSPVSPTSPQQMKTPSPFVNLNVREVFESNGLNQTKEISKRVNVEIEKKREELRTLVGERYRDLIDAADTIALMSTSSASIYDKLGALRQRMSTLPNQLNSVGRQSNRVTERENSLNQEELEIAFELKLSLEAPRVVQKFLDDLKVIQATHVSLLFERSLCQSTKPYQWAFLSNSGRDLRETRLAIKNVILKSCDELMEDFSSPPEKLAECIAAKQVLTNRTCSEVITELLSKRIQMSEHTLVLSESKEVFSQGVASTLNDIYVMFIDGQLYSLAAKEMRRPKIAMSSFGVKYCPKVVEAFHNEAVLVEDAPRAGMLAQLLQSSYVQPLKSLLVKCYDQKKYLLHEQSFQELSDYQKATTSVLKEQTEDLMRIVLGTSSSLWTEAFYPIFQRKCEQVAKMKIELIFQYLVEEMFPKYKKLDEDFDLVSYIWKASSLKNNQRISPSSTNISSSRDVDLKLKCISPQVAEICGEIEGGFTEFLKDFQTLGDFSLKKFISLEILQKWKWFLETTHDKSASLFLGRFVSSLADLSPTVWKLMDMKDGSELRSSFSAISEKCWAQWATDVSEKFSNNLKTRMDNKTSDSVAMFMPVAEECMPEGEDAVKPSVRVPIQISHLLHSSLFQLCHDLSRVGPQSVPKTVREEFRQSIGNKVISLYKELIEKSESNLSPQTALQLIFDIKFCQWFHLKLKELADPVIKHLQSVIDPFDMDIVAPKLKANLKRFLFETHLTLGLLFSEESHSFIAQNFKTKMNMSFPISNPSLSSPLPLLPV